jgi:hypothetical protein
MRMSEGKNKEREREESSSNTSTKNQTKLDETHRKSAQFLVQNHRASLTIASAPHPFLCLPCSFLPPCLRLQKASQATKPTTTEINAKCDDGAGCWLAFESDIFGGEGRGAVRSRVMSWRASTDGWMLVFEVAREVGSMGRLRMNLVVSSWWVSAGIGKGSGNCSDGLA